MNRKLLLILLASLFFVTTAAQNGLATEASPESTPLPTITLRVPDNDAYRDYLGLKGDIGSEFTLEDIDADILLIELFSMYCPFCQEEAPLINELFHAMEEYSRPDLKVKIIGLGANNSEFEVDHFKSTYNVRFPLFADQDMSMYNALEGKGTPGFIGCARNDANGFVIVLRQSGGFYQANEFLNELLHKSGRN
jgi:peroxiredoxin